MRFRGCGFRKEAFVPSYGMAEATLGITFAPLDRGIEVDRVDLGRLRREGRATPTDGDNMRELVLCGLPLRGHELEIRGADDRSSGSARLAASWFAVRV